MGLPRDKNFSAGTFHDGTNVCQARTDQRAFYAVHIKATLHSIAEHKLLDNLE